MKFSILLLLITMWAGCVFAQKEIFIDSAFYNFDHGNYPRAIQLYKQMVAKTHYTYQMELLAMCYARMDSVEQEKRVLEDALKEPDRLMRGRTSVHICYTLADIYFKEKNYARALSLYTLYGVKWQHAGYSDVNIHAFNLRKENIRSKCFEGLYMIDSAASILTPYIFCTYKALRPLLDFSSTDSDNLRDSLRQDSLCARYLTLLKKLHTNKSIKAELKNADASFYYTDTLKHDQNSTFLWKKLTCGFMFFGTPVIYRQYEIAVSPEKLLAETKTPFYSKDYHLRRFRQLPLYRMIMSLPD